MPIANQDKTPNPKQDIIRAPWTEEQVVALNEYQKSGVFHPYTSDSHDLIATREGWVETRGGPVVQTWAHAASANPELIRAHQEMHKEIMSGKITLPHRE